jgi:phosphoserine phosphatase
MIKHRHIVWDFDGTLLPNTPYDSEQTLMMHKLQQSGEPIPSIFRMLARFMIHADKREHLRKSFKIFYIWFMKGTPAAMLDQAAEGLADKICVSDRTFLLDLAADGYTMLVLSCGTADLSERILKKAGLRNCFKTIAGNRFQFRNDTITGMTLDMNDPIEKVKFLQSKALGADATIAIGDGYTDIPLLDWAGTSILVDRDGKKRKRYAHKNYHFISSISEMAVIL